MLLKNRTGKKIQEKDTRLKSEQIKKKKKKSKIEEMTLVY